MKKLATVPFPSPKTMAPKTMAPKTLSFLLGLFIVALIPPSLAWAEDSEDEEASEAVMPTNLQRGGRMEFDARLIRGETAGAGAVFLFQRTPRALPSMIQRRSSYLGNTVHTLLGPQWEEKFDESKEKSNE